MDITIENIGYQIDTAEDNNDIEKLLELSKLCQSKLDTTNEGDRVILRFYEANCFSAMAKTKSSNTGYLWGWNNNEKISEILALRQAVSEQGFPNIDSLFQCKILTNLGNSLNHLGRFVEAIKYWDKVLAIKPNFAMALGNKGVGLVSYARSLYDHGHAGILVENAKINLERAISGDALWDSGSQPDAKEYFSQYLEYSKNILSDIEYNFEFGLNRYSLGDTDNEIKYRQWCINNRLFLSPLNDAINQSAAAQDVIHLPSHTYGIEESPRFPNYYNLLKQEYVTARHMLYEGINCDTQHSSDNEVLLLDGFDGVQFGYRAEQLKIAYRLSYSIFDKIALFLNDYFSVGLKASAVSFKNIWSKNNKGKAGELYPCFSDCQNWPLRGLYYLSKDLFDEDFLDVSLPDADELAKLRNFIEHRFLSLQIYPANVQNTETHTYITISDFEKKTLRILSMAREAMIYLSLAMYREEELRDQNKDGEKLSFPMPSTPIERM